MVFKLIGMALTKGDLYMEINLKTSGWNLLVGFTYEHLEITPSQQG